MPSPATAAAVRAVPLSALIALVDARQSSCLRQEVPRLGALHETLMREELVRCFGSAVLPDIYGARDELSMNRPDPPYNQVRVAEVTHANCAVKAFADDVDETVTVARMHLKARMSPRELSKYGCQML